MPEVLSLFLVVMVFFFHALDSISPSASTGGSFEYSSFSAPPEVCIALGRLLASTRGRNLMFFREMFLFEIIPGCHGRSTALAEQ